MCCSPRRLEKILTRRGSTIRRRNGFGWSDQKSKGGASWFLVWLLSLCGLGTREQNLGPCISARFAGRRGVSRTSITPRHGGAVFVCSRFPPLPLHCPLCWSPHRTTYLVTKRHEWINLGSRGLLTAVYFYRKQRRAFRRRMCVRAFGHTNPPLPPFRSCRGRDRFAYTATKGMAAARKDAQCTTW